MGAHQDPSRVSAVLLREQEETHGVTLAADQSVEGSITINRDTVRGVSEKYGAAIRAV